jgi:glycosyltransferase involved in cell wall biosynthesis
MDLPTISVVIPVYNSEQFLERCIDSILNQGYRKCEVLLIDDGSTDRSGVLCDRYERQDSRVRALHKQNDGPSSARNLGISEARNDWLVFIDSDDWLDDTYFEIVSDTIKQYDRDLHIYGTKKVTEKRTITRVLRECHVYEGTNGMAECFIVADMNRLLESCWNKVYRGSIISKNYLRFNPEISYLEDLVFNVNYFKVSSTAVIIDKAIYNYRYQQSGTLSHNICETELYESFIHMREEQVSHYKGHYEQRYANFLNLLRFEAYQPKLNLYDGSMERRVRYKLWREVLDSIYSNGVELPIYDNLLHKTMVLAYRLEAPIAIDTWHLVYNKVKWVSAEAWRLIRKLRSSR